MKTAKGLGRVKTQRKKPAALGFWRVLPVPVARGVLSLTAGPLGGGRSVLPRLH
jgi:hypothetical protein